MGCNGPRRFAVALAALTLVAACQEGVEVAVTQGGGQAVFTADPRADSFEACVRSVYVYAQNDAGERALWSAIDGRTARDAPCIGAIRYGVSPEGFTRASAPPLEAGRSYRVALVGSGFNASARFTAGQ